MPFLSHFPPSRLPAFLRFPWEAVFADVRGIRIEDDVLVTDTGSEVLSAAVPKSTDEVEATMRG